MDTVISLALIVGRVTLIWVVLLFLLRTAGRRELAQLSPMDLLSMLLLSETVSGALVGGDTSLLAGLTAATTLIGLSIFAGYLAYRFPRIERALEGSIQILIKDGVIQQDVMRSERITVQVLLTALHHHDVENIDAVYRAYVEPDGRIAIISKPPAAKA